MAPTKWLFLVIICAVWFTQLDAQSDSLKAKIQEKRQSIKALISKIRDRIEKKQKSGKVVEKSAGSAAKLQVAEIKCAASKINGIDECCPDLNRTLSQALDIKKCSLSEGNSFPSHVLQYSLNLLQDQTSKKLSLLNLNSSIKAQICSSECLIRRFRGNSRQLEAKNVAKKNSKLKLSEVFKSALLECKNDATSFQKNSITYQSQTCAVAPYVQLQCAIRTSLLSCPSFSEDDLCLLQKDQLLLCDPFKF
ncbi:uncharacterized protein LOC132200238 [Neocloeon triangulifer]|uniref:uncharacterized protein LOC132200238 n=1 Tax=Neocloeon triangulifer TaxID=2078957 RepID=UPI00286F445B|nr:uncharacterized protein LOC132200238 [Neocloeon triangulifer]